ncbi:MAG: amino acid adenylation domain-containing protein [Acidobacteria bacterium]|nr:amino acid adenylation domain-containing protein [Acidobacteriota bacterium]
MASEFPANTTLHQLFEEQTSRTPDHIAVIGHGHAFTTRTNTDNIISITYHQLNEQAGRLAGVLIEKGVLPDYIVGIMIERSIEMIVGILGILKAGGAYLPIEPDYPQERVDYMLKDSGAKVLLINKSEIRNPKLETNPNKTNSNDPNKNQNSGATLVLNFENLNFEFVSNFVLRASNLFSSNLAYIIYTSGSTGRPKGVLIEHRNVVSLLFNEKFQFDFNDRDIWTMFHSYCFDFSVWEMYGALLYGGKLVIINKITARDTLSYLKILKRERVTILNQTPSAFYNLLNIELNNPGIELKTRYVIFGGEALTPSLLQKWKSKYPRTKLINMYGITETTVHVTYKEIGPIELESTASIIGKPIPTLNVYVMDKNLQLLPIGAPGELVVGGKGVARGYLNQPELTAEKFGPLITLMTQMSLMKNKNIAFRANFQHTAFSILHSKFYCTGDLCKWLPDGNIEFLGRIDHQVKIRGFRIELGEIEHLLCGYPGVKAVVVADKESTPGNRLLCAYIAMKEGYKTEKSTNSAELKEYLAKKLPGYMIPSFFELMDELPLTPNGKIDRQALPQPAPASGVDYIAPRSETEKRLAEIWGEVLEIKAGKIGIDNHFFQLGGHSLTATILAALVHKKFDVNIPLTEIFSTPILKDLARYIEENADSHIYLRLEPAEEREYYVLSSAQKRLYVIQQMDPGSIVYNMPGVMILLGQLDRVKFEESFKKLIQRHESLRTSFHMLDEEPVQRIHDEVEFEITYKDLAVNGGEEKTEVFGSPGTFFQKGLWPPEAIIKSFIQPFDLSKAPLLRVSLIKESAQKHILLIDMNHIISDGTSIGILANEFMALVAGKDLEPLRFQYRDWAQWQNYEKNSQQVKKQEAYWLNEFAGKIPVLNLPCDYKRPAVQDFTGKRVTFTLSPQDTESLNTLARLEEVTLYILLLSAYCVLLYKLTDREDIVIGAPTAGRLKVELQQIIGMFLNTLALRNFPGDTKPFKLFLKEVKEKVLKAFENQEYQFDDLVDRLGVKREGGRNPLFDVMFILQNHSKTEIRIPGLELKTVEREHTTTKFDFSLYAEEEGRELIFNVTYNLKLFTPVTITIIIDYFKAILSDIIKNPHQALADIKVVSGESRAAILAQLNQDLESEAGAIMGDGIFQSRLQQSLLRFKDNIAVEYSGNSVSYGELDRHSNLICRRILNRGITGNTFIGMLINHRLQLIVTLLGIIKVGSVIVPLYPGYPTERLEEMIDITGLKYLFIDEENTPRFKKDSGVEFIDPYGFDFDPREEKEHGDNSDDGNNKTAVIYNPGDPLYIHFTSGSTGKPKAILGKNRGLLHFISWEITTLGINSDFHAAQFTIPGFDPFLRDVFAPLLAGGVISIPGQEDIVHHAVQLTYYIEQRRISLIHCVTGLFRLIISSGPSPDYFRNLKYILLAGEKTNPSDLIEWYETFGERVQLLNCYGPTETTMSKAFYFIKPGDIRREKIPVGRPLVGARIVILDENNNLCAPLTPGEICIRTPFGSCGYFNAPALNREKFIPNPFSSAPGDLIYRSGDLGRILADGNLDILGRTDRQVKIRGYRVEPADIERHLINHPEIKDAMVLPLGDDRQDIFLCAYIIPQRSFTVSELREYLSPKLPDYMIPTYFVQMERFPLTARGKIDRGALPEPGTGVAQNFIAPANEIEKKLLGMWSEVLAKGENEIGVGIDFVESGGHSLKAAVLAAKIHKEFDVNVPLAEFFKTMTIRGLSQYIRVLGKELHLDIEPTEKKWFYPLSSAQRRLYFLQMMEVNSSAYNIPRVMKINGKINIERLENVFKRLILEHESLRVSFHMVGEDPVQKIHDHAVFEIEYKNLTTVETEKKIHQATFIIHHFIRAFDLSKAPLLRVGLLKTAEEEFILMVDMHHIISDGVSIQVLVRDFSTLYAGKELPGIKLQYKDYAEWQNRERFSQKLLTQGGYWKKECEGEIPVLELPTDYSRPPVQSFEGNWVISPTPFSLASWSLMLVVT